MLGGEGVSFGIGRNRGEADGAAKAKSGGAIMKSAWPGARTISAKISDNNY